MIILIYATKLILISGLLYAYYWIFLRNRQFHRYNRLFLLLIPVIALVLPFLNIPIPGFQATGNPAIRLLQVGQGSLEESVTIRPNPSFIYRILSGKNMAFAIYGAGALVLLIAFLRSLFYIRSISRKYAYERIGGIRFFQTEEKGAPFSFFNLVFWSRPIDTETSVGQQVLRHELFHVQQKHSLDILFLEIVSIVCWFNPFFHIIKKEIKAIHEFLADQYAISGNNRYAYAELLLLESIKSRRGALTHAFFNNQIKRRITMITTFNEIRNNFLSRLMVLPLLLALFCTFAFKVIYPNAINKSAKPITVIIDAGHGGTDEGVAGLNGIKEKDINLSLAKKIKELAPEYNVIPILTREKDELSGNTLDVRESLEYRARLATTNHADLFLSIHTNGNNASASSSGFEIYISDVSSDAQTKSIAFGSTLTNSIKKDYQIADELKRRSKGIYVLKASTVPAVLLECGYLTNPGDEAFIGNEKNQEKIARDILEGISNYRLGNISQAPEKPGSDPSKSSTIAIAPILFEDSVPITKPNKGKIYKKVEIESEFPGGNEAWANYLNKNLHYPQEAINNEIQGDVLVQFIVNKDGSIGDVKVIDGPKILRAESVRIVKESGNWIPAMNNGQTVKCYKRQPIKWRLEPA